MNIKKLTATTFVVAISATLTAAVPEISGVTMTQANDRLVTITYKLADAPAVVTVDVQTNNANGGWASIGGEAVWNAMGDVWKKVEIGNHTITWRPDHSWPDHKIADGGARAVVTAWALDNTPDYMAVDVSDAAQPGTQTYYPAADFVPGGVTNGLYKTTKLLMRKIMAKDVTWTMGSTTLETQNRQAAREATHQVTLTNNYYIGVYEVTQSQWSQVATNSTISANFTTERFMRPMEKVCYNEIRLKYNSNAAATADEIANCSWPKKPNPSSFLGLLRSKTGLDFDLPSEAQWEFAARAGNGVGYWNDGSAILNTNPDDNLKLLGRYERNGGKVLSGTSYVDPAASCGATNGTAIVGSYAPNAWGLYDMHGNVWEWCLDWYADDITAHGGKVNIDPATPANTLSGASGANRVNRGGSWYGAAGGCRPAFRNYDAPATRNNSIGFRVVCTAGLR
jgi:formylglycine-generating enzyme required for sulfatase activity